MKAAYPSLVWKMRKASYWAFVAGEASEPIQPINIQYAVKNCSSRSVNF